jgi:hypothetical protein
VIGVGVIGVWRRWLRLRQLRRLAVRVRVSPGLVGSVCGPLRAWDHLAGGLALPSPGSLSLAASQAWGSGRRASYDGLVRPPGSTCR